MAFVKENKKRLFWENAWRCSSLVEATTHLAEPVTAPPTGQELERGSERRLERVY